MGGSSSTVRQTARGERRTQRGGRHAVPLCALQRDRHGRVRLFDGLSQTGPAGHSLVTDHVTEGKSITVDTVVGDEFVANEDLPTPTVVKIDVEGSEWQVLTGLRETLSHPGCRLVYCELHDEALRSQGQSPEAVIELLEEMGYTVEVAFERAGDPFVRAERRE